ncbi:MULTISPECIES: hypothetical protein [unclassified Mesorhizobium]|uniref:hypothetical protein n=1 Tax=unclassified Mesorhizobium TaxID=325217 RepID=UPI001AECF98E|nr:MULTISPECIES: hypothetical protein [unclassified Mesorhizobium]
MDFFFVDWLGTPAWFWLAFLGLVVALTAFDLGVLHKEAGAPGSGDRQKPRSARQKRLTCASESCGAAIRWDAGYARRG